MTGLDDSAAAGPPTPDAAADADGLDNLTYEQAREELVRVVHQLEAGGTPLEESLALWERGERLATVCQRWLDGAQAKIEAARSRPTSTAADPGS